MTSLPTDHGVNTVICFIKQHSLIQPHQTIVIGLSGGPDSVFLLHTLSCLKTEYNLTLITAHLDHEWRDSSKDDALLCKNLAITYHTNHIEKKAHEITPTKKANGSLEEHGRLLRRTFFETITHEHKAHAVALGHHQDDQYETFFMRLIRGTTVSGLGCMRPHHGIYIRPLLPISKQEIIQSLAALNLAYCQDPTNTEQRYLRNRLRLHALPALKTCDSRIKKNTLRLIKNIQDVDDFLTLETEKQFSLIYNNQTVGLDSKKLMDTPRVLHERIILKWLCEHKVPFVPTERFFQGICSFLCSPKGGKLLVQQRWYIEKKRGIAHIIFEDY